MPITVGAAAVDITPPVNFPMPGFILAYFGKPKEEWDSVDDPLFGKAIVLDDGKNKIALVITDLLWIDREFAERVRRLVEERAGIPAERVMVCATQTHNAPFLEKTYYPLPESRVQLTRCYVENTARLLAGAICMADARRRPARLGWAFGSAPDLGVNRRAKRPDGKIRRVCRPLTPEEKKELTLGPVDPQVGVLRMDAEDGAPITTLVNYACHPNCAVESPYALSADYPAIAMRAVEKARGGVGVFALGCAGDINPNAEQNRAGRRFVGEGLGAEALRVLDRIEMRAEAPIRWLRTTLELPKCPFAPVEELRKKVQQAEAASRITNSTRFQLGFAERTAGRATVPFEIQVFRVGGLLLVGLPSDVFVRIGLAIKAKFPDAFVVNFANDFHGYVMPAAAYDEGDYEPTVTNLGRGSGEEVLAGAIRLCEQVSQP